MMFTSIHSNSGGMSVLTQKFLTLWATKSLIQYIGNSTILPIIRWKQTKESRHLTLQLTS